MQWTTSNAVEDSKVELLGDPASTQEKQVKNSF